MYRLARGWVEIRGCNLVGYIGHGKRCRTVLRLRGENNIEGKRSRRAAECDVETALGSTALREITECNRLGILRGRYSFRREDING